jgi:peptidoglycan endopeptidase LytE
VFAQTSEADPRQTNTTIDATGAKRLETDLSVAAVVEESRPRMVSAPAGPLRTNQLLLSAIQSHLGSPYYFTGTGPNSFDCSGFVWRSFQEAGINFTRGPARSYWATMPAPPKEEQFKFGTLVFFSGQTHIGIVADEKGFYHSSRHHGVVYSPFNDYWLSRIDGFRRAPVESVTVQSAKGKAPTKTAAVAASVEEDNEP